MIEDKVLSILKESEKKILLYHTDTDGICSAALFLKFFGDFETVPREGPVIDEKFLKWLIEKKADLIVTLDIPIDQEHEKISLLEEKSPDTRIVLIDHHVPTRDINSEKNIHMNPRFQKNIYIPASVLVYRLLEKIGKDVKPFLWIAALGVVGDYAFDDCSDVLSECARESGTDSVEPELGYASKMLMSAVILHGTKGVKKGLEIMIKARDPQSIKNDKYLSSCFTKVDKEIKRVLSDFSKRAKEHADLGLMVYRIKSRMSIASTISSLLSEKHPDKIIIIQKHGKEMVKVSARYQEGDINLNDLLRASVKGIGSGGGHERAAGAIVNKKDIQEFERRLVEKIAKLRKVQ